MAHPLSSQATDTNTTDYNDEVLDIVKKTAKACSSLVELAVVIHQELVPHDHQRSQLDEAWSHSMLTAVAMYAGVVLCIDAMFCPTVSTAWYYIDHVGMI